MTKNVLSANKLTKSYTQADRSIVVLKDLEFAIAKGEVVAIVGRSGSGKSTLLNVLAGLDSFDSGDVKLAGKSWSECNESQRDQARNVHMGFVYQFHHLLPEFTALENVMMPARIKGLSAKQAQGKATELLAKVGLAERATHFPSELSGGERQRVAIARALINDPAVVLMDEPTGNLDESSRNSVLELVRSLTVSSGQSFVIVTHDDQVAAVANRKLTLSSGVLI